MMREAEDGMGRTSEARGARRSAPKPNGTKQVRTYDDAGQLTQLTELAPDGVTVIYSGTHSDDAAGPRG